jgi:hypothetical protein
MPSFSTIPSGWSVDRYAPASFSNVGTYQGMNNVLGIGINTADVPPDHYSSTQGERYAIISGGAGSVLQAELYIPTAWGNAANGNVRTDMWGEMSNGTPDFGYPIIGFTNYGVAGARLQVWDDTIGWIDLANTVNYNAWTTLSIAYTGSSYVFGIDGATVYTQTNISGATGFQAAIMQAYNFADPSMSGTVLADYTAHWANTPEPGFYGSLALGMGGLILAAYRRRKASA